MNVVFFVEDTYGPIFLENLLRFLRKESLIREDLLWEKPLKSPLNNKIERILRAKILDTDLDVAVILRDADGRNPEKVEMETLNLIRDASIRRLVRLIVLEDEIEEWACISFGYSLKGKKASRILKEKKGYSKEKGYVAISCCNSWRPIDKVNHRAELR
jgi:hypothetical protein